MKFISRLCLSLACVLVLCGLAAHAATVGQLSCSDNVKANLSFYDLAFTNTSNIGSQSSGAGAGKVTVMPLRIHTSLVNFIPFFQLVTTGRNLETCKLTVRANGDTIVYTFTDILVTSVTAGGKSSPSFGQQSTSFLDVQLSYGKIEVESNGQDDGGVDMDPSSGGWNVINNRPV